jgi:26S proteasome regulatory subunit N10
MLVKIAKKLKKYNVAVDVVSFGHEADNEEKLAAFHSAVNSNDNSHLVSVPPGPVLSDVLIGSPIFQVGTREHHSVFVIVQLHA